MIRKNQFTGAERQAGEAAWLLGASFITEGDPFAARRAGDPGLMVGSAVTGALVMGFGNESRAPHGIWVVGLISKPILYILAILIGTAVGGSGDPPQDHRPQAGHRHRTRRLPPGNRRQLTAPDGALRGRPRRAPSCLLSLR